MFNTFKTIRISLVLSTAVFGIACNNVNFSPFEGDSGNSKTSAPVDTGNLVPPPVVTPPPVAVGNAKTEVFRQYNAQKVDILFVVDNSKSMQSDQAKMGPRFTNFISSLQTKDWQIGVTTTDLGNGLYSTDGELNNLFGSFNRILTPQTSNASNTFRNTVIRPETVRCNPECGSGVEEPLRAILRAIDKRNTQNAGFFRDWADLAVVILSDEDEMSDRPAAATTPQDVVAGFRAAFGTEKKLQVHSFVIPPGDQACMDLENQEVSDGATSYFGTAAKELSELTGGTVNSICLPDYGPELSRIGQSILGLMIDVELLNVPIEESIEVTLTPADPSVKYTVNDRKISFSKAPSSGTEIRVKYREKEKSNKLPQ